MGRQQAGSDMQAWLAQGGRWGKPQREPLNAMAAIPEDDLLAWVLADSNGMPLSRLFCEQLLVRAKPEHAVLWLSDAQGVELASASGCRCAISPGSANNSSTPAATAIEARSPTGSSKPGCPRLHCGRWKSAVRQGQRTALRFVRLGGPRPGGLIGGHGTSLYVDFDKRLVVATFASYPGANSPAELALLEQVWKAIERATFCDAPGAKPVASNWYCRRAIRCKPACG